MLNALLNVITPEIAQLCLYYGGCLLIIVIGLIVIGCLKRKTKKELRAVTVKNSCLKAKAYAEEILHSGEHTGAHMLLGSTKLASLSNKISDAAWYAFQIVQAKKDLFFEGIANDLDGLATELANESSDGYIPANVYEGYINKAIVVLDAVVKKLDDLTEK